MRDYRKIETWGRAHELVKAIYIATKHFPKEEIYGLTAQMRRAAVSIPANIAEGANRKTRKEFLRYLYISMGSMAEIEYYFQLSKDLNYLDKKQFDILETQRMIIAQKLYRLAQYVENEVQSCPRP